MHSYTAVPFMSTLTGTMYRHASSRLACVLFSRLRFYETSQAGSSDLQLRNL
jgi:hypothetical protein